MIRTPRNDELLDLAPRSKALNTLGDDDDIEPGLLQKRTHVE
jgi:hypothetical protein